jgi:hypothetical protein
MSEQRNQGEVHPGGRTGGASEEELGPIDMESATPGPMGAGGGGDTERGPASNGSMGSGTYNERGDVTGPDSPAGADLRQATGGGAQGDDLADRLGGGEGSGAGGSAASGSGDMSGGRSEADDGDPDVVTAGAGGPDAGSPGGMGGARTREGAGTGGRPPGGTSPIQAEEE